MQPGPPAALCCHPVVPLIRSAVRRPTPWALSAVVLASLLLVSTARAQEPVDEACPQGRIATVFVDNHSVFDLSDPDRNTQFDWAYRLANEIHIPTREEVIRREILFREGDCYDPETLRESERLLRAADFIADVDIFGVRQPDGSVHVIVDTQDEWSTRVQPQLGSDGGFALTGVRLREDNLLGRGQHLSVFYLRSREDRVYGASFETPQLFKSRWDAALEVGKTSVGDLLSQSLAYPFVGERGRWAFRQSFHHHDRFFEYRMLHEGEPLGVLFAEQRRSFDVGAVYRWGGRFHRTLLGAALVGEQVTYPRDPEPRFVDEALRDRQVDGLSIPVLPELPMDSVSSVRLMILAGQRNIFYTRRRGFDTVRGTEDVRLGVEAEVAFGPSLPGSTDNDLALDLGLFAGTELPGGWILGGKVALEGRRSYDTPQDRSEWVDVFGQLNGWSYWRPSPESRHTYVAALSAVGGWHTGVPFQLTLGSNVGLRGFGRHVFPGGRRVTVSLEQRSYLGWPYPDLLDLGSVVFVDAGRIWAGDAPFGVDSPYRLDVGVGLRAAFPPGSRQTFRVDVGVPVVSGVGFGDVVISVGVGQIIGRNEVDNDPQLVRSARQGVTTSVFTFPN